MPHVDVPDKHFGVALGEARTLRTATKGAPGTQDRTSEMATCEDGIPTRGAGSGRGPCYLRSQDAGQSGEHRDRAPPGVRVFHILPKVAVGGWRWGKWWEMSKGTRGTMAGAHLGGRGAGRRRSCSATAAPREGARRRGHADGRHHPRSVARLFFVTSAHEHDT